MADRLIRLENIHKDYGGKVVLKNINLYVRDKEFVTLLGPSGCGKTTTLRIIGGFETPSAGVVYFDGKDITSLPAHKRQVNTVFQRYALFPHLNIFDNIAFGPRIAHQPEKQIRERVEDMLRLVNLTGYEKAAVGQLSGGEQQRVAIARAIVNNPSIVIADEPTGNLDPETSWDIMDIFRRINKAGTTIVMATHDRNIVDTMKRRVIAIEDGRIVRDQQRGGYGYEA